MTVLVFTSKIEETLINCFFTLALECGLKTPPKASKREDIETVGFKRIIGGVKSSAGEWPWMARLTAKTPKKAMTCGGAILSRRFILTAAHCFGKRKIVLLYLQLLVTI